MRLTQHEAGNKQFIKKQILEGRQAYIICPLVDESDEIEAKSALKTAKR